MRCHIRNILQEPPGRLLSLPAASWPSGPLKVTASRCPPHHAIFEKACNRCSLRQAVLRETLVAY
jgi:hypothetical protein